MVSESVTEDDCCFGTEENKLKVRHVLILTREVMSEYYMKSLSTATRTEVLSRRRILCPTKRTLILIHIRDTLVFTPAQRLGMYVMNTRDLDEAWEICNQRIYNSPSDEVDARHFQLRSF